MFGVESISSADMCDRIKRVLSNLCSVGNRIVSMVSDGIYSMGGRRLESTGNRIPSNLLPAFLDRRDRRDRLRV